MATNSLSRKASDAWSATCVKSAVVYDLHMSLSCSMQRLSKLFKNLNNYALAAGGIPLSFPKRKPETSIYPRCVDYVSPDDMIWPAFNFNFP